MSLHTTLRLCISVNVVSLCVLFGLCLGFGENNVQFMKFGPQPSLEIFGICINTWTRYAILQALILCFQVTDVLVNEFASPILGFNVYNPDKKVITEFTKFELQCYCQTLWFVNNMKSALMLLVSISQIDIAMSKVAYAEITSIYTIRTLINKKKFLDVSQHDEEEEAGLIVVLDA